MFIIKENKEQLKIVFGHSKVSDYITRDIEINNKMTETREDVGVMGEYRGRVIKEHV